MTDPDRRAWTRVIMGLPISLHLRGPGVRTDAGVEPAVDAVFEHLRTVDRLFSPYRPDSQVSLLRHGRLAPAERHPWVAEVAQLCDEARDRTDGYFDARLPGGYDPSGLVKGWAAQNATALLDRVPHYDFCLNAGGDVITRVRRPGSPAWRVGVEDPRDRTGLLTTLTVRDGAVATSGTAARGHHIVNPRTAKPARTLLAATISGPSLLWADVFATAAVARGGDVARWLRSRAPDYEAHAITSDRRTR
ncbi:FAD:protein FMN transferase [Amycolatopsis rhabdoformis]|uniref:FAD:protein FMN transferase n=1 Tax=Amycolatopsis rhabdoformis TaxID=1448059 RepID=A0ABZ1ID36_9PSEU|nr:FAD:protein FMN transferase [Amycolatopsis rhabdoformis]WSE32167.1 FAD:protein FMN transferase [Amycolatopsis rhabdoformis]